jgi:primosomal replication protein N
VKRAIYLGLALVIGLASSASAQNRNRAAAPTNLPEGTPVEIVGFISSQPRDAGVTVERKMQVAVGPQRTDYTLHLNDAQMFDVDGSEVALSAMRDRWWVRAVGTVMSDSRRIDVNRLQVLSHEGRNSLAGTPHVRNGFANGYVMPTGQAFVRGITPANLTEGTPVEVVGVVSSQPRDAGVAVEKKMQVAIGPDRTDYTLHLNDARMYDVNGQEIAASDFRDRWWVRAVGTAMDDSRRIRVDRLQVLAKEDESFRTSQYYRQQFQHGYVLQRGFADTTTTRVAGERVELGTMTYTGTVAAIDRANGWLTIREANGNERRIDIGRNAELPNINVGDRVNIRITNER